MKHLKLFEDFFTYFRYDKLPDEVCEPLFGISREDIKYRLMDVVDDVAEDIHVSISFSIDGGYYEDYKKRIVNRDGTFFKIETEPSGHVLMYPIKELKIEIIFFPGKGLIDSRRGDTNGNIAVGIGGAKFNTQDIIDKIKESINNHKIIEVFKEMGYGVLNKEIPDIDFTYGEHPDAHIIHGKSIYSIWLTKKYRG